MATTGYLRKFVEENYNTMNLRSIIVHVRDTIISNMSNSSDYNKQQVFTHVMNHYYSFLKLLPKPRIAQLEAKEFYNAITSGQQLTGFIPPTTSPVAAAAAPTSSGAAAAAPEPTSGGAAAAAPMSSGAAAAAPTSSGVAAAPMSSGVAAAPMSSGAAAAAAPAPRRMTERRQFLSMNPYAAQIQHPVERETNEEFAASILMNMKEANTNSNNNHGGGRRKRTRRRFAASRRRRGRRN
jgi:hypothetical protein